MTPPSDQYLGDQLDNAGRKLNRYVVVRTVRETYEVWARDKDSARLNIQDPNRVEVLKESIKLVP